METRSLLSVECSRILEDLISGKLDIKSFHSKRWYARKHKNIKSVIDLSTAWEIYKIEK